MTSSVAARRKNLPVAEKIKILQNESPELLDLLNEFKDKTEAMSNLKTLVGEINKSEKRDHEAAKFIVFQYRKSIETYSMQSTHLFSPYCSSLLELLMNYLTNISFYLSLKAAGTSNIRNHPVIGALVELRGTIEKMEKLATKLEPELEHFIEHLDEPVNISTDKTASLSNKNKKASSKKAAKQVVDRESDEEDDGADLYSDNDDFFDNDDEDDQNADSIEQEFKSLKKQANKRKRAVSDNDFGDLDMMEEVDMEDKLAKKRSIRDYVAKIETVSRDKYSMKQAWPTPFLFLFL